ncbi:MAG: hypothetical protein ACRDQX_04600, partial [Pseudonocardiaceae bacterium]
GVSDAPRRARQAALVDQAATHHPQIPPDKQPGAIKLVPKKTESMAPRCATERSSQPFGAEWRFRVPLRSLFGSEWRFR